ncbi:MAG: transporter substrate-binding domain-containing protein [Bermanella sp.]
MRVILLLMICLFQTEAWAKHEVESLKFVSSHFAGISELKEKNGVLIQQGLGVDIVHEIARRLGIKIEIEILPFKRALVSIQHKKYDAIFGVYKKADRLEYLDFLDVAFYEDSYIFYSKVSSNIHWNGKMSQYPKAASIGWITGWSYFNELYAIKDQIKKVMVTNLESNIRMLEKGRVDFAVGPVRDINPLISRLGLTKQFKVVSSGHGKTGNYIAFAKGGDLELQNKIRATLTLVLKTPWYQQRLKYYKLADL